MTGFMQKSADNVLVSTPQSNNVRHLLESLFMTHQTFRGTFGGFGILAIVGAVAYFGSYKNRSNENTGQVGESIEMG